MRPRMNRRGGKGHAQNTKDAAHLFSHLAKMMLGTQLKSQKLIKRLRLEPFIKNN